MGALLENFIGDLVGGTYSKGSDEEDKAKAWFDRCGFGIYQEETLLKYLLDESYDVEEFLYLLDNIENAEIDLAKYQETPDLYDDEEMGYTKSDLEDWKEEYHQFIDEYAKKHPEANMEVEIEVVKKWFYESEALKNE